MADPLGLIGSGGAGQVRGVHWPRPTTAETPSDPNAPSFKDALMRNIQEVNRLQEDASTAAEDLVSGKRTDVETVLTGIQKADTAFRMLLAVRNKVQAAYEEIKQVRI